MATYKQIGFIEKLISEKNIDESVFNSVEAQTIRIGRGEELSTRQASNFIELLLSLDNKETEHEEFESRKASTNKGYRKMNKTEKAAHDAKVQARLNLIEANRAKNN